MRRSILEGLRCPASGKPLELRNASFEGDILLEGELVSSDSGLVYTVHEGAAYLAVLDDTWPTILKELINRREIIAEDLHKPLRSTPETVDARKAEQDAVVSDIAEVCFAEARKRLPEKRPLRLIDLGAGMFETSVWFASQGIDVVATETEISMVRYANFTGEGRGDPQPFEIGGRLYHIRDPRGHPDYFTRVVCDIQRLPFADGFFDVAFCRAMLHHVDDPGRAIREMARVVRPGGLVLICAEPSRGVLDREEDFHEETVDREEGMNEQVPTILAYRRPLEPHSSDISIQYWPFDKPGRTERLMRFLPIRWRRHLWPGEVVANWKWRKLLPIGAALNIYATRNSSGVSAPAAITTPVETIEKVARVYIEFDDIKTIDGLEEGTEKLKAIRRGLLARRTGGFPSLVEPGLTRGMILESGWGRIEDAMNDPHRFVLRRASVIMGVPAGRRYLEIVFGGGRPGFAYQYRLRLNGETEITLSGEGALWRRERIALPKDVGRLVQIEFHCLKLNDHAEARTRVGVAVKRLEIV